MFLRKKKGQSTAEYAILLGLIAAVAAGFLSVGLKGAIRNKGKQTTNYLLQAGNDELQDYDDTDVPLYTQEQSETTIYGADFKNVSVMEKGGSQKRHQVQKSDTSSISIETIDEAE